MRLVKRIWLEVIGWGLFLGGIAALVLPGPGLLMVFAGIAVLSQQYEWAERRLDPIKYRALKGAAESVQSIPRIVVSVLGVLGLFYAASVWLRDPEVASWWSLPEWLWLPGGTLTGLTLILSGLVAAALIVYSYRRFHDKPEAARELQLQIEQADRVFYGHDSDD